MEINHILTLRFNNGPVCNVPDSLVIKDSNCLGVVLENGSHA